MLTENRIQRAVPPHNKREINLRDEEGLVLRVRRNADGSITRTWAYWKKVDKKRQRATLGTWPAVDLVEARRRAAHHRKVADTGMRVATATVPAALSATPGTVGELFEVWLKLYAEPRHKDRGAGVRWALGKYAGAIETVPLPNLSKQHITLTVLPLVSAGHHKSAADLFALLKQITAFGARHDFLATDPAASLRRSDLVPRRNAPRERVLSESELQRLSAAIVQERTVGPAGRTRVAPVASPVAAAAVAALLATAARSGELAAATWKHVDLEARTWAIPAANSKTGKAHLIPLSSFAVEAFAILRAIAAGEPAVLPMGREALGKMIRDRQRPGAKSAKSKRARSDSLLLDAPWSLHDLRRTAATMMADEGVAESIIERCLSHAPPRLVRTYQRSDRLNEMRAAFDLLGARLAKTMPDLMPTLRERLN